MYFSQLQVDFGCILNDTEVTQVVTVTNHSPMDVKYQWSFIDCAIQFENKEEDEGLYQELITLILISHSHTLRFCQFGEFSGI